MFVEEKGGARPLMCAQKRAKTSSLSANYAIVLTPEDRPVQPKPFRASVCAARTLNATGQSRVTLSLP